MKKILGLMIAAGIIFNGATASATLPKEAIALGGVAPGATVESAKAAFGKVAFERETGIIFANGISVEMKKQNPRIIHEIQAEGSCSVATPAGVRIGMSADVLNVHYGKADEVDIGSASVEYKYYSHDKTSELEFEVENGVITKIECEKR